MVVRSGFEVQLVYADSKTPLKEFEKDGKIYVEAEPDAEYFISIRRIDRSGPPTIISYYYIDGSFLGYTSTFSSVMPNPSYKGLFSRNNGVLKNVALKFSKPQIAKDGDKEGYRGGMGKAEIKLYHGLPEGIKTMKDFAPDFDSALAGAANAADGKKKFLLSTKGSTTIKTENQHQKYQSYGQGALIDSITLNYCSALGMIEAGVLPKPDMWTHERMKRPARPGQLSVAAKSMKDPVDPSKLIELIDLSGDE
jgi:hypothetical protein